MISEPKGINHKFQGNFVKLGTGWDGTFELKPQKEDLFLFKER